MQKLARLWPVLFLIVSLLLLKIACGTETNVIPTSPTINATPKEEAAISISVLTSPTINATPKKEAATSISEVPKPTPSRTPIPLPQVRVLYNSINVRSGPGIEYASIAYLYLNDLATVLDTNADSSWYLVQLDDNSEGWVGSTVVELMGSVNLVLTPTIRAAGVTKQLRVSLSSVSLRSGPGTDFPVIEYLYVGDIVNALGVTHNGNWYNVQLKNGKKGWLAASVVEPIGGQRLNVSIVVTVPAAPERNNASSGLSQPSQSCCKICTVGKACGNSCISRSYTCHQPAGCACNAAP